LLKIIYINFIIIYNIIFFEKKSLKQNQRKKNTIKLQLK